jgi:hypothetical protein
MIADPSLRLVEITADTLFPVIRLAVAPDQRAFVADNGRSGAACSGRRGSSGLVTCERGGARVSSGDRGHCPTVSTIGDGHRCL